MCDKERERDRHNLEKRFLSTFNSKAKDKKSSTQILYLVSWLEFP